VSGIDACLPQAMAIPGAIAPTGHPEPSAADDLVAA
jgi:hypothetical protein